MASPHRVGPGDAVAGHVIADGLGGLLLGLVGGDGVRNDPQHRRHRGIPEDAVGLAVRVHLAELVRGGGLPGDAGQLQGQGVGHVDMLAVAADEDGVLGGDGVQVLPGGHPPLGEGLLVEVQAPDPLALGRGPGPLPQKVQHPRDGIGAPQLHAEEARSVGQQVQVGVDEARQHGPALEVHRFLVGDLSDLLRRADGRDLAIPDGEGFHRLRLPLHGVDPAVHIDLLRVHGKSLLLPRGIRRCSPGRGGFRAFSP